LNGILQHFSCFGSSNIYMGWIRSSLITARTVCTCENTRYGLLCKRFKWTCSL